MSFSNPFRSFANKKPEPPEGGASDSTRPSTPPPSPSHTLEELSQMIAQERTAGQAKNEALEQELRELRASMEKMDVTAKSSREAQSQTLQFLQQDAEREIKYFERKLKEDTTHWDKQLKEREKNLEQAVRQGQTGQAAAKTEQEEMEAAREAAARTEAVLKEQDAKLVEERQKWRDLLHSKETELVSLRQELVRREQDLAKELAQQDSQRKASQELWQSRLTDLERQ